MEGLELSLMREGASGNVISSSARIASIRCSATRRWISVSQSGQMPLRLPEVGVIGM